MGHPIGKLLTGYKIIIDKSTVPVGTAEKVQALVRSARQVDYDFQILNA